MRDKYSGTYLIDGDKIEKLNTKTDQTISPLVRNSKWLNVTPVQNMWEQLQLTYSYGVDKLWILNVGDLKPMEYPITLFMNMAWNPERYAAGDLLELRN